MKAIQATRKIKNALSEHFSNGGTVDNVQGDLKRVDRAVRQQCFEFWKKHKTRRNPEEYVPRL